MTGDILRRIRESRGFTLFEVAEHFPGVKSAHAMKIIEERAKTYAKQSGAITKKQQTFKNYLDAMRLAQKEKDKSMEQAVINLREKIKNRNKNVYPKGTTHVIRDKKFCISFFKNVLHPIDSGYDGEPARISFVAGRTMGFKWDGKDWIRSREVEELAGIEQRRLNINTDALRGIDECQLWSN